MKNHVLTKEQMEVLEELGVDISKASMCRVSLGIGTPATDESMLVENDKNFYGMSFPVFTVVDMLGMLPMSIGGYDFDLYKSEEWYIIAYINLDTTGSCYLSEFETLIDTVFDMLCQLLEDGKLNNTPK